MKPASTFTAGRSRATDLLRTRQPVTWFELVLVVVSLALLSIVVFGAHVLHGGLYLDDWGNAAEYRFIASPHYLHAVQARADDMGARPLLAVMLPLLDVLFGTHSAPQLALALALGVVTCLLLYLLLRTLGLELMHSAAISGLVLIFPWADSIRLWAVASLNTVALCFGLAGLVLALRSIERDGRRARFGHALAIVLFVLSILTYEVMAPVLLVTLVVYWGRAPHVRALRWWLVDAVAVGLALIYTAVTTNKQAGSASQVLHNAPVYAHQSLAVLSLSFVPPGVEGTIPRVLALLAGVVAVALVVRRQRRGDVSARRLLVLIGTGALLLPFAYLILLASYLQPLGGGAGNRGNIFAAVGYAVLAYGIVLALAKTVAGSRRRLEVGLATALVVAVGLGYGWRAGQDASHWDRAAALQAELLHDFDRVAPSLPAGTTLISYGFPADVAGAPVFNASWDLDSAVRLRSGDQLRAQPFFRDATLRCLSDGLSISLPDVNTPIAIPYRSARFANLRTGHIEAVASRTACLAARRSFRPGPRSVSG